MTTDTGSRSRNTIWLIALGTLLYAVFLVVTAPASVLTWILERESHGMIAFEGTRDSLWKGKADVVVVSAGARTLRFRQLTWTMNFSRLLRGELSFTLSVDDPDARGKSTLGWSAGLWQLSATALDVAFAVISPHSPVLLLANPNGRLWLRTENLALGRNTVSGMAELEWRDASTDLSRVVPLGTYRAKIEGAGTKAQFSVDTKEGALQVRGQGFWSRETGLRFDGSARAAAGRESELHELLRIMGPDTGGGVHRLHAGA